MLPTEPLERLWTQADRPKLHTYKDEPAPPGPWWDEPDKVQWVDDATDLDCLAVRNHWGAWCGYVGVPTGHPWHGMEHDEGPEYIIEVHGGLTFSDRCNEQAKNDAGICHVPFEGRPADVWWFGFDCGHAWDIQPTLVDGGRFPGDDKVYRTLGYVRGEVVGLAAQLAEAGKR